MWPFKKTEKAAGFGSLIIPRAALEQERARQISELLHRAIADFADVAQESDPLAFYDVERLPHSKELLEGALIAAIKIAERRGDIAYSSGARVMLESLLQYQEGVGKVPVRLLPNIDGLQVEQMAKAITAHAGGGNQEKWERLNLLASNDRLRYAERLKTNDNAGTSVGQPQPK